MKGKKKIKRNAVVIDQNFEQYLQNTYITQSRICSLHKVSMDNEGGGGFASPSPGKPKASREYSGDYLFVRINGNSIHCWYYLLSMANPISENRIVERSWTDARTRQRESQAKSPPSEKETRGDEANFGEKKCWRYLLSMTPVAPIGFNGTTKDVNSGGRLCKPGGALAFNEAQFWWTSWTGLKKGGKHLGNHRCHCHPSAPFRWLHRSSRVSKKKVWFSGKEGGALKFRGASAVFLNGINPGDYDDVLKTMKIHQTTK